MKFSVAAKLVKLWRDYLPTSARAPITGMASAALRMAAGSDIPASTVYNLISRRQWAHVTLEDEAA